VAQSINSFFFRTHAPAFSCLKHVQDSWVTNRVKEIYFPEQNDKLSPYLQNVTVSCLAFLRGFRRFRLISRDGYRQPWHCLFSDLCTSLQNVA
jgi:hypothetical protein